MKKTILKYCFFSIFYYLPNIVLSQQSSYLDGRPGATKRIACIDEGIVLSYGDGPDSCDILGAREAIVNKENGTYYLFYDGAGKDGWRACLAESNDLKQWTKKGAILNLGEVGANDSKCASSPWVIKEGKTWHMFYLGTPNTSPAPDRIPSFPYLTMKAKSVSLKGPWIKQSDVIPFSVKKGTFFSVTASPGFIVKYKDKYLQFFSGATLDSTGTICKRTLGIASTKNLDGTWKINDKPIVPLTEQIENSSIYYEEKSKTWYLFTNHIGIDKDKTEYTDAIWVYWSKDIYNWDIKNKAIVLDSLNCTWSKGAIGMPSVIKVGNRLALFYDAYEGFSNYHMKRNVGLAWITLPIRTETTKDKALVNLSDSLDKGFITPPDSIQTSVYWYWISDNISKEGVINDLHAMKQAGINRAFIGNIGLSDVPYGNVKMLSEEWWDILHTALKAATELNIEIGIFNSPGWSQSGGPWVKADAAMRYLTASEFRVKGPLKFSQKLEIPIDIFQDVKVIAYPAPKDDQLILNTKNGKITSTPRIADLSKIVDGDNKTGISFPAGSEFVIDMQADAPFTARSLSVRPTEQPMNVSAAIQVKGASGEYRTLSEFQVNRSNPELHVGFEPYAPVVVSFPATTATNFRLVFKNVKTKSGIAEVVLAASPRVERYSEKTLAKMHQTPLPYWKEYQWAQQPEPDDQSTVIDATKVIDISQHLSADGTLTWDVPEGEWVILRTGMTPTGTTNAPASPEATGYEVDKMSKKHVAMHFDGHMGEVLKRIPEADRKTFKVVVQDSYETGGQNFTDDFLSEFKQRYGYDAVSYLPVYKGLVVNSELASDRFLWDMRRMVADKVAYDYVGGLRDISHKYGLHTWLECYGHWGFPSEFLMYGGQSDEIGGEFWSEGELGDIENRAATSCGHIYGKTKISAESNTCAGSPFSRYPGTIKQRGDRFFAEGINNTLLHVYITQPYEDKNPGMNAWFGNEFNRKNIWFTQMDVYTQYLKRTNFMLQQGLNVADVAYFIGEDAPKMTGVTDPALPVGYQFDYMNAEVIEKYMTVKDGLITLPHGSQYRILVLPKLETMRPELLTKIKQLVNDGAVILGPAPKRSPSLQNQPSADQQVQALAKELWGDVDGINVKSGKVGKGTIISGMNMTEAFALINCVHDCKLPEDRTIHYGHRTIGNGETYFVTNQTAETKVITPEFRVKGKQPELWEATTGSIRPLSAYIQKKNTTAVPLKLEPYESVFIVFRKSAGKSTHESLEANFPMPALLTNLKGPWTVTFNALQRGPEQPVVFETLQDWTTSTDERIKYYSGTAIYNCKFKLDQLPGSGKVVINLGSFTAMAKVTVNGTYVGGLWTAPYQLDITPYVKVGDNDLKIEVVNTWVNRLIGDSKLPLEKRLTWCSVNPYKADSPLQPSGLFGPVVIQRVKN